MQYKKIIAGLITMMTLSQVSAQQSGAYSIEGTFPGAKKVYLASDSYGQEYIDSASNVDGSFLFKGTASKVKLGSLVADFGKKFPASFSVFIEPGDIHVQLANGGEQIEIKGSPSNEVLSKVELGMQDYYTAAAPLYDSANKLSYEIYLLRKQDTSDAKIKEKMDRYIYFENKMHPLNQNRFERLYKAFETYPQSYFTAFRALDYFDALGKDTAMAIYNHFGTEIQNSDVGKEFWGKIKGLEIAAAGTEAPLFTKKDINGKIVDLKSFRGKYVLLDYWATWCGPCRAGNPELIKLFKKYNPKGLEIIGIADDDKNLEGWKKAIMKDGIGIWPQVLRGLNKDSKAIDQDLTRPYNVHAYPTKILIDKEGVIIGRYQDDNELVQRLESIFGI